MMRRFLSILRLLLGLPIVLTVGESEWRYDPRREQLRGPSGALVSATDLLPAGSESEDDHTKSPPFDLAFSGLVPLAPPVRIFREERFRVCLFESGAQHTCEDCGRRLHWLTLELWAASGRWHHLVTLPESRLPIMRSVLSDVDEYLCAQRARPAPDPSPDRET